MCQILKKANDDIASRTLLGRRDDAEQCLVAALMERLPREMQRYSILWTIQADAESIRNVLADMDNTASTIRTLLQSVLPQL